MYNQPFQDYCIISSGRTNQYTTGLLFYYILECPALTSISNGNVNLALGHWEGSIATYVCQNDYALVGSPVRKCLSTGQWTGVEPSCIIGKTLKLKCRALTKHGAELIWAHNFNAF